MVNKAGQCTLLGFLYANESLLIFERLQLSLQACTHTTSAPGKA